MGWPVGVEDLEQGDRQAFLSAASIRLLATASPPSRHFAYTRSYDVTFSYGVPVSRPAVTGDEPLVNGMRIALRLRRDFVVTDAEQLLAAARRAHRQLNPGTTEQDAAEAVTCAADAVFTLLEQAGLLGNAMDTTLTAYETEGLALGGWRAQVTFDDPRPLPPGPDCFNDRDVYALPDDT